MIDSPAQLVAILVVALLLFGPRKLPELARGLGQSVREFKKSVEGLAEETQPEKEKPQAAPHAPQAKPPVEGEGSPRG